MMLSNILLLTILGFSVAALAFAQPEAPNVNNKHSQNHVLLKNNVQQIGTTIREVTYEAGEWTGYISCDLTGQSEICDLSIHEQGNRIDINQHQPNMEVLQSCYQDQNSIGLRIHNFSYSDVQDYTCLSSGGLTWDTNSGWLWDYPHLEAYVPDSATVGDRTAFTCQSYAGTPLYWVLPGVASDRGNTYVESFDDGINSTSVLTFNLIASDNYGAFWCCAKMKADQETLTPCTLYNVAFNKAVEIASLEFYEADATNWEIVCQFQGYPDPGNVEWKRCNALDQCFSIESLDELNTLSHVLTSNVTIAPTEDYYYYCSAENTLGSVQKEFFTTTNNYAPLTSINYKTFYYSADGFAFRISCTVTANPKPDMYWTMQNFWSQSNGSISIYPDQPGKYQVINSLTGVNTYDSTLLIQPFDFDLDHATFGCVALNNYGYSGTETEAELGPNDLKLRVTGGYFHEVGDIVETVFTYSGFPPPNYNLDVFADNDIGYQISEHYENTTGVNQVNITFLATADNPHVQINASAFFPYVLFANELSANIYISESTTTEAQ